MQKNFSIGQSNELVQDGIFYDLHNFYDFAGFTIGRDRCVRISFEPNAEHGKGLRPIVLEFDGVDYLELSHQFGVRAVHDLSEMGYKNPNDRDDEWLLDESQAGTADHLFFRFSAEDFIRIHSESARLCG